MNNSKRPRSYHTLGATGGSDNDQASPAVQVPAPMTWIANPETSSFWAPSAEDLKCLNAGGVLALTVVSYTEPLAVLQVALHVESTL